VFRKGAPRAMGGKGGKGSELTKQGCSSKESNNLKKRTIGGG